jgi:hypothetical protein
VCTTVATEFRTESLAEPENKAAHHDLWSAVAQTAVRNVELVDIKGVESRFTRFFGAVQMPGKSTNGRHKRKGLSLAVDRQGHPLYIESAEPGPAAPPV